MKPHSSKLHRFPRQECARDPISDIDPLRISVRIGEHSDVPLETWRDQIKRKRREIGPRPGETEKPETPDRRPPDGKIDEYAAPI